MGLLRKLYAGENDFDFRRLWRIAGMVSLALIVGSVLALFTRGLNLGIDFKGGVAWELEAPGVSVDDARSTLTDLGEGNAKIQIVGRNVLRVQAGPQSQSDIDGVTDALAELAGSARGDVSVSTVGPSWGDEITRAAARALVWFFVVIAAYITVRLEWRMAAGALVAVVHDILISVGVYAVFQFEVTPSTVIAFLTILGYSLYDTIVVYDKVHENHARSGGRESYGALMSRSLNEVLMRSINTTITSLLPVVSMLVIGAGLLGALTLRDFSIALFVGLVAGGYSSLFIAAPAVVLLHREDPHEVARRERAERRAASATTTRTTAAETTTTAAEATPTAVEATTASSESTRTESDSVRPAVWSAKHPPRPRKKGRRR